MNNLLEKAKKIKALKSNHEDITREDAELAMGWAEGKVSLVQVKKVKNHPASGSHTYVYLARAIKKYFEIHEKI